MKKIINGKAYDTSTAACVGSWDNGRSTSDFGCCSEDLYRKRTGEFFLYGEGGPMSKYAKSQGNGEWGYGNAILPLNYNAAQKWAEEHLSGDEYEAIFGEIIENDSRTAITITLSASALERAKRAASQAGISLSAYIEGLL